MTINSELKTDLEGFNNLPPRQQIIDWMDNNEVKWRFVDLSSENHPYFQNGNDTMVIAIKKIKDALEAGAFAIDFAVDEFHKEKVDDEYIIRMWWD